MKAIHNTNDATFNRQNTVFNISKIQNESNSQLKLANFNFNFDCVQYFKDTK